MFERGLVSKIGLVVVLFFLAQLTIFSYYIENLHGQKLTIEGEIDKLKRKKDALETKNAELDRDTYRLELRLKQLKQSVRDVLPLTVGRKNMPMIYFITPTYYRPTQKADLTRLSQTLDHVPNLHWIVVEDSSTKSESVAEILERSGLPYTHLNAETPAKVKMGETDPNWKYPRGVLQRNAALSWIRVNLAKSVRGIIYFGDDDNTYDERLFVEMRSVNKVGVWPVGIVGGRLVEAPIVTNGSITSFNAIWKANRTFPIDMAAFAVNISLVLESDAAFTYDVPRGFQETYFLTHLSLNRTSLEPKASGCKKVLVWHTRTERAKLSKSESAKFQQKRLEDLDIQAVG